MRIRGRTSTVACAGNMAGVAPTLTTHAYQAPTHSTYKLSSFGGTTVSLADNVLYRAKKVTSTLTEVIDARTNRTVAAFHKECKRATSATVYAATPSFSGQKPSSEGSILYRVGEASFPTALAITYRTFTGRTSSEVAYRAKAEAKSMSGGRLLTVRAPDGSIVAKASSGVLTGAQLTIAQGADLAVIAMLYIEAARITQGFESANTCAACVAGAAAGKGSGRRGSKSPGIRAEPSETYSLTI